MVFGRKGTGAPAEDDGLRGHRAVLEHLAREEHDKPLQRAQVTSGLLFDQVYQWLASPEKGTRIEDLLGLLASNGGYACIVSTLEMLRVLGKTTREVGMIDVETTDGARYYFGDLPNRLLWESEHSLLSLALGAAQHAGGEVSAAMVQEAMARTAKALGSAEFASLGDIPAEHRPTDRPIDYVQHTWPHVLKTLELYAVPPDKRATTLGFTIARAIEAAKGVIDPTLAARIVIECAVPMAKLDPARFAAKAA